MKPVLAPFFLILGTIACLAQTKPSKPLVPDALLVAPKATDVKYETSESPCKREGSGLGRFTPQFCGDRVTYLVNEPYPAANLLAFIRNALKVRHWRLLQYDYPNNYSFSDDQKWFIGRDARQKPANMMYEWWAIWENDKHDLVSYVLRYQNPAGDLEASKKTEHLMHSARVEAEYVSAQAAYHACKHARIVHQLEGSESWSHRLGSGLEFRMDALQEDQGWTISVSPTAKPHEDWTYPVNFPVRGQLQNFGSGDGMTVRERLQGWQEIRFALNTSDYKRYSVLLDRILENDESARNDYDAEMLKTPRGLLVISALGYDTSDDGMEVYSAKLKCDIVVPKTFSLDPSLKWTLTRCPGPEW